MEKRSLIGLPLVLLLAAFINTGCPDEVPVTPLQQEQSAKPTVTSVNQSVSKTGEQQKDITFILSSDVDGEWKVYSAASGSAEIGRAHV